MFIKLSRNEFICSKGPPFLIGRSGPTVKAPADVAVGGDDGLKHKSASQTSRTRSILFFSIPGYFRWLAHNSEGRHGVITRHRDEVTNATPTTIGGPFFVVM